MCDERRPPQITGHLALAREAGTCNFCNRQITQHGVKPQARVMVVRGDGLIVRFCRDCWLSLVAQSLRIAL